MYKRLQIILITILALVLLSGTTVFAEENGNDEQGNAPANSWRYENGSLIEPEEEAGAGVTTYSDNGDIPWGIDVSEWQGDINWEKVKAAGVDFAILRCGRGNNIASQDDKKWLQNVSECERLGIPYGVYIYSYATNTAMAESEAEHVLRLIQGRNLSYPVYYDMEEKTTIGSDYAQLATTFCTIIENAGYRAGVYANLDWWNNRLTDTVFEKWDRWVAQYNTTCDYRGNYSIWQYGSKGRVDGISGNVDMNYLVNADGESVDNTVSNNAFRPPYSDVNNEDWFNTAVRFMYQRSIMTGLSEREFGPYEYLSRGHFVTILYRIEGEPETSYQPLFPDVPDGYFFSQPIAWAATAGIASGYEDGNFGVSDSVTREQMVVMMYRYAQSLGVDVSQRANLERFPDIGSVSGFAADAMHWAVGVGMIQGSQGQLNPTHDITRAEAATIIMRFVRTYGL